MPSPSLRSQSVAVRLRARGFVLPVVLVMLVVMSTVVLLTIRRGTVDERLASNMASVVTMESGANYTLRFCERWIRRAIATGEAAAFPDRPAAVAATAAVPSWRDPTVWGRAELLPAEFSGRGVDEGRCLFEDAAAELVDSKQAGGLEEQPANGSAPIEYTFAKFRITAEARGAGPQGLRIARAQSELRIRTN